MVGPRVAFRYGVRPKTVMSDPYLAPETLDRIVDLLHNKREPLKACCLVSKSWVSRTRKHLFADIDLSSGPRLWEESSQIPPTLQGIIPTP